MTITWNTLVMQLNLLSAVGCANPPLGPLMYLRRDGSSNTALVRCNTTSSSSATAADESNGWRLTCLGNEWQWHGPSKYNCTSSTQSSAGSDPISAVRSSATSGTASDDYSTSWTVGQMFPFDTFPYSQYRIRLLFISAFNYFIYSFNRNQNYSLWQQYSTRHVQSVSEGGLIGFRSSNSVNRWRETCLLHAKKFRQLGDVVDLSNSFQAGTHLKTVLNNTIHYLSNLGKSYSMQAQYPYIRKWLKLRSSWLPTCSIHSLIFWWLPRNRFLHFINISR